MQKKERQQYIIGVLFLIVLAVLLIVRCFFSFCQTDESFYAALINRFWHGERLIQDEWHRAQFYAPLLLPFYGGYSLLHGSSEGVILFLRILYIGFSLITSIKLFSLVLKETSDAFCAAIVAAITLLFSRANISGVSYYNLCMLCVVSGFCSIAGASWLLHKRVNLSACWGGVLLACAVLCNPFLAPVLLVIIIAFLIKRSTRQLFVSVLIGIVGMAAIYCLYLVNITGIQGVLRFLPFTLQNSEQNDISANLSNMLDQAVRYAKLVAGPAVLMSIVVAVEKKNLKRIRILYVLMQTILLAIYSVRTIAEINGIILFILTVIGLPFWVEAWKTKQSVIARQFFSFGIIIAISFSAASNTGLDAGTVGFCVSGIGGIWLIRESLFWKDNSVSEEREPKTRNSTTTIWARYMLTVLSIVVLVPLLCQRMIGVYRDAPLWMLNTKLEHGPARGLYTTESHAKQYESICASLSELETGNPEGRILFCKNLPWAYLVTEYKYGTSSPWRVYTQELETYYSVCPENRADFICILNERVGNWEKSPLQSNPAKENPNYFDYEGDFWAQVVHCPILTESEWLCVYDVRELQ